jgi:hypothetical protein
MDMVQVDFENLARTRQTRKTKKNGIGETKGGQYSEVQQIFRRHMSVETSTTLDHDHI